MQCFQIIYFVIAGPLTIIGRSAYFQLFLIDPRVSKSYRRRVNIAKQNLLAAVSQSFFVHSNFYSNYRG